MYATICWTSLRELAVQLSWIYKYLNLGKYIPNVIYYHIGFISIFTFVVSNKLHVNTYHSIIVLNIKSTLSQSPTTAVSTTIDNKYASPHFLRLHVQDTTQENHGVIIYQKYLEVIFSVFRHCHCQKLHNTRLRPEFVFQDETVLV